MRDYAKIREFNSTDPYMLGFTSGLHPDRYSKNSWKISNPDKFHEGYADGKGCRKSWDEFEPGDIIGVAPHGFIDFIHPEGYFVIDRNGFYLYDPNDDYPEFERWQRINNTYKTIRK